jgi:glycosyltransferase involved in cell wall biosynthesis
MGISLPAGWKDIFVVERPLSILQVSTEDMGGGAANVAWNLFQAYRARGLGSWMAVGCRHTDDPDVLIVPNSRFLSQHWALFCLAMANVFSPLAGRIRGAGRVRNWLRWIGQPRRLWKTLQGHENFGFPGTWRLLGLPPKLPDIAHCHNLHIGYFDLRALPWLSRQVPVVLTLHDAWLLSGHCAHSLDCQRWKTGCGHCPDLTLYPAIRRDASAYNWQQKRKIYAKTRAYVATPSRWLMKKVEESMLAPAVIEARVIPNGVDLCIFHPADRQPIRASLGIPQDARVILSTARNLRQVIWKDYQTMHAAVVQIAESLHGQCVFFLVLGEDAPAERIGEAIIRFIPYQEDPKVVARYYQASDVYVHAARAEAWGLAITEALACGIPVVATAVAGVPEQVKGLRDANCRSQTGNSDLNRYSADEATGMLVPPGNAQEMAACVSALLTNETLRSQLGANAARDGRERFDLNRQVEAYIEWYQAIAEGESSEHLPSQPANVRKGRYE